ncbi:MAG: hypothetical protein JW909_12445 [Planctomycetes bacterium]|nr:hypothetical protein [Planctomycetota bacterium]
MTLRHAWLPAAALIALSAAAEEPKDAPQYGVNLVANSSFEQGSGWQPANWSRMDRLSSFWEQAPSGREKIDPESLKAAGGRSPSGRYLRIDTDVLLSQYEDRRKELDRNPSAAPPARLPVKPPGYDTVGGTSGVAVRSDPIPIDPEAYYNVAAWCKGTWEKGADFDFMPMIFVKGYTSNGPGGREREVVRKYLACRAYDSKGWQYFTWQRAFAPGKLRKDVKVEYVRLVVFCYWPRHSYGFDDIRFFRVPEPPDSEKSRLETDREGKHGTAVNPDEEEEWLPSPRPADDKKKSVPAEDPEGFDALKGLISERPE